MTRYLTLADASPLVGLAVSTLRGLCAAGRIHGAEYRVERGHAVWYVPVRRGKIMIEPVLRGRPPRTVK